MSVTIRTPRPFQIDLGELGDDLTGAVATMRPMSVGSFSRYQSQLSDDSRLGEVFVETVMAHLDSITGMTVEEVDGTVSPFSPMRESHVVGLGMAILSFLCNRLAKDATLSDIVRKN